MQVQHGRYPRLSALQAASRKSPASGSTTDYPCGSEAVTLATSTALSHATAPGQRQPRERRRHAHPTGNSDRPARRQAHRTGAIAASPTRSFATARSGRRMRSSAEIAPSRSPVRVVRSASQLAGCRAHAEAHITDHLPVQSRSAPRPRNSRSHTLARAIGTSPIRSPAPELSRRLLPRNANVAMRCASLMELGCGEDVAGPTSARSPARESGPARFAKDRC